jgi:hypothetical protein
MYRLEIIKHFFKKLTYDNRRRQSDIKFLEATFIRLLQLEHRSVEKSAYKLGLASVLTLVLRCFVSVTDFEYADKAV